MNKLQFTRQSSLNNLSRSRIFKDTSPFLKPIASNSSLLPTKTPLVVRRRKRIKTIMPDTQIINSIESDDSENQIRSCGISPKSKFDTQETFFSDLSSDILALKLEEKLKNVSKNDAHGRFDAYFAVFDLLIIADHGYGRIISLLKDGIIQEIEQVHMGKIGKLQKQIGKLKECIQGYQRDKENLVSKLNVLSNENINLIRKNDGLISTCKSLENCLKKSIDNKSNPMVFVEELQKKSEKIRELTDKLDEMYKNEAKILRIAEEFKMKGGDFEKTYEDTVVEKKVEKKLRKLPILRINTLSSESSE